MRKGLKDMDSPVTPWSHPLKVADIPETGGHYDLVADAETRAAVASAAGLRELPALAAVFDVVSRGDAVSVRGEVNARVGQTCVVTLDPVENDVRESVELLFAPPAEDASEEGVKRKKDVPPEPLDNGVIDLGAIATEFLVLGLDPYPRKAGVEFTPPQRDSEPAAHPFAALQTLKKRS
jgi:uncharacterized metal-binding protein YceD (DUF177 family)